MYISNMGVDNVKIGIVGSRNLNLEPSFIIDKLKNYNITEIVSGGAKGIDSLAKEVSTILNIPFTEFKPDYNEYGRIAPFIRNEQIVDHSDVIFAFWDGESRGTQHTLKIAKRKKRPYKIFTINGFEDKLRLF